MLGIVLAAILAAGSTARATTSAYVGQSGTVGGWAQFVLPADGSQHLAPTGTASTGARGEVHMTYAGQAVTFRYVIPANPRRVSLPLMVELHGVQQKYADGFMGLSLGTPRGYIVLDAGGDGLGSWNAGKCCGPAAASGQDSVGMVAAMMNELHHAHAFDTHRAYAAGFSNGGMLAYRMACERPTLFAAIAVVAGAYVNDCVPQHPVALMAVHGTADTSVPFLGGRNAWLGVTFPSAAASVLTMARVDAGYATATLVPLDGDGHIWPTLLRGGYATSWQVEGFLLSRRN